MRANLLRIGPWLGLLLLWRSHCQLSRNSESSMHSVRHDLALWCHDLAQLRAGRQCICSCRATFD